MAFVRKRVSASWRAGEGCTPQENVVDLDAQVNRSVNRQVSRRQ